jgi:predicted Zn-dependent protease
VALCQFRAGQYREALTSALAGSDLESTYWRARAAGELATAAFNHLDGLADSVERRVVRAANAHADERFVDAVAELKAAVALRPTDPDLLYDLASSCFEAGDYEQTIAAISPLLQAHPDDTRLMRLQGYALLEQQRPDEALPLLQRAAVKGPNDARLGLALGRAYLQTGDFTAAVPMIEAQLETDQDGSLHVQLARAYKALGQGDKAAALLIRSQELLRAAGERRVAAGQQTITPPPGR